MPTHSPIAQLPLAGKNRAAFVTALGLEFAAVESHLTDLRNNKHAAGTVYRIGKFAGQVEWEVAIVEAGMHNEAAAVETERIITHFKPSVLFFVGIAGGLKDVALGDVVAVTNAYDYEAGKDEKDFKPRPQIAQSTYPMEQQARAVCREKVWRSRSNATSAMAQTAFVGPIAVGGKVVGATESATYRLIRQHFGDALAVDMESYGFLLAISMNTSVQALAVRGISDLVDGKGEADGSGWQPRAAAHAAAFAFEVLSQLDGISSALTRHQPAPEHWLRNLEDIAVLLYPRGPLERKIWSRAGGDEADLEQETTGRAAWHSAARTLSQGGGGAKITPLRLIKEMVVDYSRNESLQRLATSLERADQGDSGCG